MAAGTGWAAVGDAATWQAAVIADALGRDHPDCCIWWEPRCGERPAFAAHRPDPYLVLVTRDPAELRAALAGGHG